MARAMKETGLQWLGQIPKEWNLVRIGTQYTERRTKVSDTEYPPLSVTMKGILPQLSTAAKTDAHDDRKLVCKGDFAINSRSDRRGSCGISAYDGSVSLINTILCPRDEMNPEYYDWLFHSTMFSDEFYKWGHGIVDDLWTTNWQDMKRIFIPEPALEEQAKIAEQLNIICAEIDTVIVKTKATIEEYKKLKQSVITDAVTKGIRSNRLMQDSGIKWIGEIPADWGITTIGRMCFVTKLAGFEFTKDMVDNITDDGEVPIVRAQNIKMGRFLDSISEFISMPLSQKLNRCALDTKCLIITFIGAGIGEVAIFDKERRYHLAPNVAKIVINDDMKKFISEEFLLYFLMSSSGQEEVNKIKKATAQPSLSMETIRSIKCIIPPTIEEQNEIVAVLEQKCAEIDTLITKKTALLAEMESYKKSVIYEYVTGKKEVTV